MAGFAAAEVCDTCASSGLLDWLVRSDGLRVLQCPRCGTGVVERLPGDLVAIYEGDYYSRDPDSGVGYSDYAYTAEHSVGWAAALVDALRPDGGAALDIGCADGLLLSKLGPAYSRRAGVEMHPGMAEVCRGRGYELLAHDLYDPILDDVAGAFDVVTAIAVFEHVPEFARAVRRALGLLAPDGILLFEVPLMSPLHDNGVWLTSSLEHLYYPTEASLQHLFARELGVDLAGGELHIRGYGSTFVGLAAKDPQVAERGAATWARVASAEALEDLDPRERRAWVHLHLLHAAQSSAATVTALAGLPVEDLQPAVVRRVSELWAADTVAREDATAAVAELRDYLHRVERARDEAQVSVRTAESRAEASLATLAEYERSVGQELERIAQAHATAAAEAADWERQAHQTHAQLEAVLRSSAWRATAPARTAVTSARRAQKQAALLRGQINRRRVVSALGLLKHGDLRTIRQRATAVYGTAAAAAGLGVSLERGPTVEVVQEAWPADRPLVSVVIVCFNYGQYVEDAVRSALEQTLQRIEVIVVDGGSTDGTTRERLARLAEEHPEVLVVLREGRHMVGDNRNHGISLARGRYVCCLDADDALRPVYLEIAAYLLEAHDYDLVSTSTQTFGLRAETFGLLPRPALSDMVLANNVSTVAVFRRALWDEAGGFHDTGIGAEHVHEDWKLWVRLSALGARMINITGAKLFLYRVHGSESLSNLAGTPGMQLQRQAVQDFNQDVLNEAAFARSQLRRSEVHRVHNGLVNLRQEARPDLITVLIVMPFLIVGGAERLISQISRHLTGNGFRVLIATTVPVDPSFGDTTEWFADSTTEIYHLPRLLDVDRWEGFIQYLVSAKGVQVLWLAGSEFAYALLPTLRAQHPDLKVVDLLFNTVGHTANNRAHARDIDLTIVENAEVERWLLAKGESTDRVLRAESGVDLEAFSPRGRRLAGARLRVGFSGRFSKEKDPLAFVAIAALLPELDADFVMTGAGPLDRDLRAALAARGLRDRVELLGVVDDVRAHLESLDVLLLPSQLDGRPVVVLEALALGVPVIASSVGALPELVQDGRTGFLCTPGDHHGFAGRVRELAEDPVRLASMSQAARAFAEEHLDARTMFHAYEGAFRRLAR